MPSNRRSYRYVGPNQLHERAKRASGRKCIRSAQDLLEWLDQNGRTTQTLIATFIIDTDEQLWVADRRSEHVVCAGGKEVLAAGEIEFSASGDRVCILGATNQSTGYCPEPDSWPVVDDVLSRLDISHPPGFTAAFIFRRCTGCGSTNVIKDEVFECAICQSELSRDWNYHDAGG